MSDNDNDKYSDADVSKSFGKRNSDVRFDDDTNPIPAKPKRPMTAYLVYSQLERNYIIQNHPSYQPNTHEDNNHNNQNQESTCIDENASERPPKYRDIIMPKDWFLSRRGEIKKKDRKNHGVISFVELSKTISYNWNNEADDETKEYCKRIADEQLARYHEEKAAYVEQYGEEAVKSKSNTSESTSTGSIRKRANPAILEIDKQIDDARTAKILRQYHDSYDGKPAAQLFDRTDSGSFSTCIVAPLITSSIFPLATTMSNARGDAPPRGNHDLLNFNDSESANNEAERFASSFQPSDPSALSHLSLLELSHERRHLQQHQHPDDGSGPQRQNNDGAFPLDQEVSEFLERVLGNEYNYEGEGGDREVGDDRPDSLDGRIASGTIDPPLQAATLRGVSNASSIAIPRSSVHRSESTFDVPFESPDFLSFLTRSNKNDTSAKGSISRERELSSKDSDLDD